MFISMLYMFILWRLEFSALIWLPLCISFTCEFYFYIVFLLSYLSALWSHSFSILLKMKTDFYDIKLYFSNLKILNFLLHYLLLIRFQILSFLNHLCYLRIPFFAGRPPPKSLLLFTMDSMVPAPLHFSLHGTYLDSSLGMES